MRHYLYDSSLYNSSDSSDDDSDLTPPRRIRSSSLISTLGRGRRRKRRDRKELKQYKEHLAKARFQISSPAYLSDFSTTPSPGFIAAPPSPPFVMPSSFVPGVPIGYSMNHTVTGVPVGRDITTQPLNTQWQPSLHQQFSQPHLPPPRIPTPVQDPPTPPVQYPPTPPVQYPPTPPVQYPPTPPVQYPPTPPVQYPPTHHSPTVHSSTLHPPTQIPVAAGSDAYPPKICHVESANRWESPRLLPKRELDEQTSLKKKEEFGSTSSRATYAREPTLVQLAAYKFLKTIVAPIGHFFNVRLTIDPIGLDRQGRWRKLHAPPDIESVFGETESRTLQRRIRLIRTGDLSPPRAETIDTGVNCRQYEYEDLPTLPSLPPQGQTESPHGQAETKSPNTALNVDTAGQLLQERLQDLKTTWHSRMAKAAPVQSESPPSFGERRQPIRRRELKEEEPRVDKAVSLQEEDVSQLDLSSSSVRVLKAICTSVSAQITGLQLTAVWVVPDFPLLHQLALDKSKLFDELPPLDFNTAASKRAIVSQCFGAEFRTKANKTYQLQFKLRCYPAGEGSNSCGAFVAIRLECENAKMKTSNMSECRPLRENGRTWVQLSLANKYGQPIKSTAVDHVFGPVATKKGFTFPKYLSIKSDRELEQFLRVGGTDTALIFHVEIKSLVHMTDDGWH